MTALITGASSGIGIELARLFASDGYNLILVARRTDKLNELKVELESAFHISVNVFTQDLTRPFAAKSVFDFTQIEKLSVDVLVNNAGFGDFALFAQCNLEKQQQMMQLNMVCLTELTYYFLPQMLERKSGRILNVASLASFMPGPKMAVYYATKAYVRSFSEALHTELKKSGISVTALCPGPVKTAFWDVAEAGTSQKIANTFFADSLSVAKCGYKNLMRGKALAIPGFSTKCSVFLTRLFPRSLIRKMVYAIGKYIGH